MKKQYLYFAVIIAVISGIFWYFTQRVTITTIDSNTIVTGDYTIKEGERVTIANGSTLTIEGDLVVKGEIVCQNGPLILIVNGSATIENKIECERAAELQEQSAGIGISMVVRDSLTLAKTAKIITSGHLQFVESLDRLATTKEQIEELYEEAGSDTGEGNRLGPFSEKFDIFDLSLQDNFLTRNLAKKDSSQKSLVSLFEIPKAKAGGKMVNIRGEVIIKTPPRGVNLIVVMRFPNSDGFNFVDFWLVGPDGRKGKDDKNTSCNAKGDNGQDAMRLFVRAPNIKVQDFTLELGSGGDGGDAISKKDCEPGKATGGQGGKAGNFKMIAFNSFDITGQFTVYPGRMGSGGSAEAYGKNGNATKDGADAIAIGGNAKNNEKTVRVVGTITGQKNIFFGSIEGGRGGSALAVPGDGGDGRACKSEKGGDGGDGIAQGGKGGSALIFLRGGAQRTKDAKDIGGDGGFVQIIAVGGGNGSTCKPDKAGGLGGKGGNAKAIPGEGGVGGDTNGKKGDILNETGGPGGNGGDGCLPGKAGKGGEGNPDGRDGLDGKNICALAPEEKTAFINLSPQDFVFEHSIGFSPCPQLIGTLSITKTGTADISGWALGDSLPNWLTMETSGSMPGQVLINFSCVLEQYITQTLSSSLDFQLLDMEGSPIGEKAVLNVTGYITGE